MDAGGFKTKLCKPRHPFTKGKVERLIGFVKGNFIPGRCFVDITQLNREALQWCHKQNNRYHQCVDCTPQQRHAEACLRVSHAVEHTHEIRCYLCPERRISFDGFVNYEGRRFGVPFSYSQSSCRVMRDVDTLRIYSLDLETELVTHPVTWTKKDRYCADQFVYDQPFELPTAPVTSKIRQVEPPHLQSRFDKFNFEKGLW